MPSFLGSAFKRLFVHPLVRNLDVDSMGRIQLHRALISRKKLLKRSLLNWYSEFRPAYEATKGLPGKAVELGSGAGFIEEIFPDVIKTDIVPNPFCRETQDAAHLSYPDQSVRAILMVGVLHHLEDPALFFDQAKRVLVDRGRICLVEPNNSFPQKLLCKLLDHYEYFDFGVPDWKNRKDGVMSSANLAIPWLIFHRDRKEFERRYPELKIVAIRYHTLLIWLLSGGMTYRAFMPGIFLPLLSAMEWLLSPVMKYMGTAMTVEIEKT